MIQLPRSHYILLGIAGAAIIVYLIIHISIIRPMGQEQSELQRKTVNKKTQIRQSGWPLDFQKLEQLAAERRTEEKRLIDKKQKVLEHTTSLFKERIKYLYEDWKHFEEQVSRLDYQQEYQRIKNKLQEKGINLDPEVLRLSEDTTDPRTHELVLKLWTLEAVADKILAYNLKPLQVTTSGAQQQNRDKSDKAAAIQIIPTKKYFLNEKSETPYLLQFRARLRVRGEIDDLYEFLNNVSSAKDFIAVTRMELYKMRPVKSEVKDDTIEADLTCAAYYLLNRGIYTQKKEKKVTAPRGV